MKLEQLPIPFIEEPKNEIYYNGLGEPLPWEEDQARNEGWVPSKEK